MSTTVRERKAKKLAFVDVMQDLSGRLTHEEKVGPPPKKGGVKHQRHEKRRVLLEQIRRDLDQYRVLVAED